jgi:hypothetical protein
MKNKRFISIGIVVLIVLNFAFIACDLDKNNDNGGNDPFKGTWIGIAEGVTIKIVADNGTFNQYHENVEGTRGTYTHVGNTVTMVLTEINPGVVFGSMGGIDGWVTYTELDDSFKPYIGSNPAQITINGNIFEVTGVSYTKQ